MLTYYLIIVSTQPKKLFWFSQKIVFKVLTKHISYFILMIAFRYK